MWCTNCEHGHKPVDDKCPCCGAALIEEKREEPTVEPIEIPDTPSVKPVPMAEEPQKRAPKKRGRKRKKVLEPENPGSSA